MSYCTVLITLSIKAPLRVFGTPLWTKIHPLPFLMEENSKNLSYIFSVLQHWPLATELLRVNWVVVIFEFSSLTWKFYWGNYVI